MSSQTLPGSLKISVVDWAQSSRTLRQIRTRVFIEEQHVPEALEWDGLDTTALHLLAQIHTPKTTDEHQTNHIARQTEAVGTARIIITNDIAHIGRMAVLPHWRGKGIGYKILQRAILECQQRSVKKIILNAQTYVLNFYQKAGFKISSDEFIDAGIMHKEMTLLL